MQGAPIQTTDDWTATFDTIIDCRSPAEFERDHTPSAINCWSLNNNQRQLVGVVYKQDGAFAGRRLGAGLVSANIARHLATTLADKPKQWCPLIYCWRGGQRSGAMATVLSQIGYRVTVLERGYKAYRNCVLNRLPQLCVLPKFVVLSGRTGVGKTRVLKALAEQGEQILDLEDLACHRGSLFGGLGLAAQPSPPYFDSLLYDALRRLDFSRPVWTEAESAKIGALHLPQPLVANMRKAPSVHLKATLASRVETIMSDYIDAQIASNTVRALLAKLPIRISKEQRFAMEQQAQAGDWRGLATALIQWHYDPSYRRSTTSNFVGLQLGEVNVNARDFTAAAQKCQSLLVAENFG